MSELIEIRWHGRGGQGAKTAATFLASVAINEGKYSQGYPDYGPERMGAPMRGFTRISDEAIKLHCEITNPDIVVVLDDTLLGVVNIIEGIEKDGILIVNTVQSPQEIKDKLAIKNGVKVYTIDATGISIEELKRPIPNTPMIGALIKVSNVLKIETVYEDVKVKFGKKFREDIVKGNINAIRRAYEEVKE